MVLTLMGAKTKHNLVLNQSIRDSDSIRLQSQSQLLIQKACNVYEHVKEDVEMLIDLDFQ